MELSKQSVQSPDWKTPTHCILPTRAFPRGKWPGKADGTQPRRLQPALCQVGLSELPSRWVHSGESWGFWSRQREAEGCRGFSHPPGSPVTGDIPRHYVLGGLRRDEYSNPPRAEMEGVERKGLYNGRCGSRWKEASIQMKKQWAVWG